MIEIIQAETPAQIAAAQVLFREYEDWLGLSLCFQNFDAEVAGLPGKYAAPEGRLLLIYADEKLAGCIAFRKLENEICEMKRLFVREDFRGRKLGNILIERIIKAARAAGYRKMRLDTFPPKMGKAAQLYEAHDFREIPPYYQNPYDEVLFMEKDL